MHAAELPFLFGRQTPSPPTSWSTTAPVGPAGEGDDGFDPGLCRHGDPNGHANPELPHWPHYETARRAVMSFAPTAASSGLGAARREWWTRNVYAPAMADCRF